MVGLSVVVARRISQDAQCVASGQCAGMFIVAFIVFYIPLWISQLAFNAVLLWTRRDPTLNAAHRIELREDGLYQETPYNRSLFLWKGLRRIARAGRLTVVYVTAASAVLIPDSAFSTRQQRLEFFNTLKARMAGSRNVGSERKTH